MRERSQPQGFELIGEIFLVDQRSRVGQRSVAQPPFLSAPAACLGCAFVSGGSPDIYAVVGPYLGKYGAIGDSGFNYNVMAFSYQYPGANRYNYSELYMYLDRQIGLANLKLEVTPTLDEWFGVDGWKGVNYAVHSKVAVAKGWAVDGSFGYQKLTGHGAEGWRHWNIGVTKPMWGLNFDLRYHDTDVDRGHKVYGDRDGRKIFKERVVFAVSKNF